MLSEADFELEVADFAAEMAFWHGLWSEVEDLEGADTETEKTVHGFLVVWGDDAHFCYSA